MSIKNKDFLFNLLKRANEKYKKDQEEWIRLTKNNSIAYIEKDINKVPLFNIETEEDRNELIQAIKENEPFIEGTHYILT